MATFTSTQELYCLVPPELADLLLEPVREHLALRGVATIVERRGNGPVPYSVARQRAMHLRRALPDLPGELAPYAHKLTLVQRMPPAGLALADVSLMDVIGAAQHGDGVAASELVFRVSARIHSRLQSRHGQDAAADIERVLGVVLDRIESFDGPDSAALYRWLDAVVDDR